MFTPPLGERRYALEGVTGAILDDAVPVLVQPGDQADILPGLHPGRRFRVGGVVHRVDESQPCEGGERRGSGVQQGNEYQGIPRGLARIGHLGDGKKTYDDVGQAGGAGHQHQGDGKHVDHALAPIRVGNKTQVHQHPVQFFQHSQSRPVQHLGGQAQLRHRVARDQQRDEDRRRYIGKNHDAILRHLGIGNAFHAAQHGIEEHHRHADKHAGRDLNLQETGEHHPYAAHLPRHIGKADEHQADHGHHAGGMGIIALADEVRHGVLAELAQVRRQQQRQQDVAAGPAHQVHRSVITGKGDHAGDGNE